jgi:SAM-dependent methyltransferase
VNFDNSVTVRMAEHRLLVNALRKLSFFDDYQRQFVTTVASEGIRWADATRHIPLPDRSADLVYSSHMLEHLDRREAKSFLTEARRVLVPGGIVRLVVPDLERLAREYVEGGDADTFMERSMLAMPKPTSLLGRVRRVVVGDRHHHWMYDARSLSRVLAECGFDDPRALPAGDTTIADPGALDLRERESESLYIEAIKPA